MKQVLQASHWDDPSEQTFLDSFRPLDYTCLVALRLICQFNSILFANSFAVFADEAIELVRIA